MRSGKRRCYARGKFSANISAHRAPGIGEVIRIPVGTMTYTFAALATARLPAEVYLLAIGNLIVHLLTVSFPYPRLGAPRGHRGRGNVPMILSTSQPVHHRVIGSMVFNHYSLLGAIEQLWG